MTAEEVLAGFDISYKLQPKTKVFFGYTFGTLRYAAENVTLLLGALREILK